VAESAACPVCGGEDVEHFAYAKDMEYYTDDESYEYLRCRACPVVFLRDPPVGRLQEIYPANYYSYAPDEGQPSVSERVKEALDRRWFAKLLADAPGDQLRVLDIGGGSGWLLTVARRACPRIIETHEVDLGEWAREPAEHAGHVFHSSRIEDFRSELQFDLIIMLNLIEHVADPGSVLDALLPLLRPGGKLLLKTPNFESWDCRLFKGSYWGGFHCPRHFVVFSRDSLEALARQRGFRVQQIAYTQGAPQWTASVMASMQRRGRIHLSAEHPMHEHPLYGPMNAGFAALDFARLRFAPTAQMMCVLQVDQPRR